MDLIDIVADEAAAAKVPYSSTSIIDFWTTLETKRLSGEFWKQFR
jgi:hypothetical protein